MNKRDNRIATIKSIMIGIIGILFLTPLIWMVLSSFKNTNEVFAYDFHWFPEKWQWENYKYVWTDPEVSIIRGYANTIFITVIGTAVQLVFASLAAYAFAKIKFVGKNAVFFLFLSTMMMPVEVTIIPRFMLFKTLGLYNSLWAVIVPHWFNATAIFMLRQFYMGLPDDLMEAAKIDGASHPVIFSKVMLPLTKSAMISLAVLSFVSCWNEYLSPLIFIIDSKLYTLSQVIRWYMLDDLQRYELVMAAATSTIIPVIAVFVACQKYFVEGIATSGMKG